MKKLIALILTAAAITPAFAQHHGYGPHGHRHYRHWHPGYGWVAPMVIGGVVTYAITRPQVIVDQPPVVVQPAPVPAPVVVQPDTYATGCSAWREIQQPDGTIVRERTCYQR